MAHSNNDRRRAIADHAVPTPRSPNGLYMDLRISLYDTDNHSAISVVNSEQPQALINCPNDLELISEFAKLVIKLRKEQAANRNIVRVRVGFGNTATVE